MECEAPRRRMALSCWAGLALPSGPSRLHFPGSPKPLGEGGYSSLLPSRNRCTSLKMNSGDPFYSSLGWGAFTTHMAGPRADHESAAIAGRSREVPSRAQKRCQPVPGVLLRNFFKRRIEARNKCQESECAFWRPLGRRHPDSSLNFGLSLTRGISSSAATQGAKFDRTVHAFGDGPRLERRE